MFSIYTVYPDPAQDFVTIEFDQVDKVEALPDEITLISENSTKPVRKANPQSEYQNSKLIDGKSIALNVKDLPRGIYYLHIINSRRQDKPLDRIRILLE
jgi:hypothetical protein